MAREGDANREVVDPGSVVRAGTAVLPAPATTATERRQRMKHIADPHRPGHALCAARIGRSSSGEGVRCVVCVDMASWGRWSDR